jgi:hypothetical protein
MELDQLLASMPFSAGMGVPLDHAGGSPSSPQRKP